MREGIKEKISISRADYDYMDDMPPDGWDWEFVRRNESFRQIYSEIKMKCNEFSGGNPLENPGDVFFYERWWNIEKEFGVKTFYEIQEYGTGIPDPDRGYNSLPDSIKPLMKGIGRRISYVTNPVKAFTTVEIERETNKTWNRQLMEIVELAGKKFAYQRYLQNILSPDNSSNTLYIGVSLKGRREDIRNEVNRLLKKYIEPKSQKGHPRHRIREWKSYLLVWDEWVKHGVSRRRGFSEIARTLTINLGTVKSRWYRAFFCIYGKKYDPRDFKAESLSEADKLCSKCTDAKCYQEKGGMLSMLSQIPCYEYLKLAGKGYLREKRMPSEDVERLSDFESHREFLEKESEEDNAKSEEKC